MSNLDKDDEDLNYYEGIRKQMVTKLTEKGMPSDLETSNLLLKAIDGGSRTVLGKKRLTVDKEANENAAATQAMIAEVLRASPTNKQRLQRTEPLPEIDLVPPKPGETEIGTKAVRYNDIMQRDPKA